MKNKKYPPNEKSLNQKKLAILAIGAQAAALNLRAQLDIARMNDISQWMKNAEQWINELEKKVIALPDILEQKNPLIDLIQVTRKTIKNDDQVLTVRFIRSLEKMWENAIHDKGIPARLNTAKGRQKAGETRKKQLTKQGKKTKDAVLELFKKYKKGDRSAAEKIAKKCDITSTRVRQIRSKEKK